MQWGIAEGCAACLGVGGSGLWDSGLWGSGVAVGLCLRSWGCRARSGLLPPRPLPVSLPKPERSPEAESCHRPTGRLPQAPEIRPRICQKSQKQEKQGLEPALALQPFSEAYPWCQGSAGPNNIVIWWPQRSLGHLATKYTQ